MPPFIPPTGLIGAEQALQAGFGGAGTALQGGAGGALNILAGAGERGVGALQPFAGPGGGANQLLSAFSGIGGPQAQQQAFANFQASPGQQFVRQQGEQSLLRNASALGGLGGGNIRKDLIRFGQGSATQALQQQLEQLNLSAGRGLQAAGQQANLFGGIGQAGAGVQERLGTNIADINLGTGQALAGGRTRAGEQIAGQIGTTTSALSALRQQQGAGLSDIVGSGAGNLANILVGAGQAQGLTQQQLAALLANIATGQGSQVAGLPGIPGVQQTQGALEGIGQAAAGIGTAIAASDERLKDNIELVGITEKGVKVYQWDWNEAGSAITGESIGVGVMAQEIQRTNPDAVFIGDDGYFRVDYSKVH